MGLFHNELFGENTGFYCDFYNQMESSIHNSFQEPNGHRLDQL